MRDARPWAHYALLTAGLVGVLAAPFPVTLPAAWAQEEVEAGEDTDGYAFFQAQVKTLGKDAAGKLWGLAKDANKRSFFQHAWEEAERALVFDPDHKESREFLGWTWNKKAKDWALDAAVNTAVKDKKNTYVANKETAQAFQQRVKKWRDTQVAQVNEYIGKQFAKAGEACKAAGHAEQAKKAFRRALSYDKQNAAARGGLGYRLLGKIWVTPEQAVALEKAMKGEPVVEASEVEKVVGVKLHKAQSPHFRIEDDAGGGGEKGAVPGGADLPEQVRTLETLYAYYLADAGLDPTEDVLEGQRMSLYVVSTKERWQSWVEWCDAKPADKEWMKQDSNTYRSLLALYGGTMRVETAEHVDTRDPLLHHAAHLLNWRVWKLTRYPWLDEGMAYYYTVKVQETTRTHCVQKTVEKGQYGASQDIGGNKDWSQSEYWRQFLREMVKQKADVALRTIMDRPLATLDLPQTVKAWGVIEWLMETRRDDMLLLLAEYRDRKDKDEKPWDVMQRVFAKNVDDIDEEWRTHARATY